MIAQYIWGARDNTLLKIALEWQVSDEMQKKKYAKFDNRTKNGLLGIFHRAAVLPKYFKNKQQ